MRDETLQVTQHVSLPKQTGSLALMMSSAALTRMGHDFRPSVHDLTVQAEGQATQRLDTVLDANSVRSVVFDAPTRYVTLRYTTIGAVHRSAPSAVGRALALMGVLGVSPTSGLSRTITVLGPHILNLGCDSPDGKVSACGKALPDGWRVTLGPEQRGAAVFAQVELSRV